MMRAKEPGSSFTKEKKEPVIDRVFQLVERYPSRSAAARAWGININTLKNYYTRRDIEPIPRKSQLIKIAQTENVSLDWLLHGANNHTNINVSEITKDNNKMDAIHNEEEEVTLKTTTNKLTELLSLLDDNEMDRLYEILVRKGVDTILQLLFEFADLSPTEFERTIRLAKQVKEGAIDGCSENDVASPTHKQVG